MRYAKALLLILGLFLLIQCAALAAESPNSLTYLQQTAINALIAAKHSPTGTRFEHGGMIYGLATANGPVLRYIEPNPHGDATSVTVIVPSLIPKGFTLLGTYHLHLCMKSYIHDHFSTQDVVTALVSGVPEFMLDECTGLVHEFYPGKDRIQDTSDPYWVEGPHCEKLHRNLPRGRIIGNIGETVPMHEVIASDNDGPSCDGSTPPATTATP